MSNQSKLYELLLRPVITEKSTMLAEMQQYVFLVKKEANKVELAQAFEQAFPGRKVTEVRLVKVPTHRKRVGKKYGYSPERRKAIFRIVGEPIEFAVGGV